MALIFTSFYKTPTALDVENFLNFPEIRTKSWEGMQRTVFFAKLLFFSVLHGYTTTLCVKQLR